MRSRYRSRAFPRPQATAPAAALPNVIRFGSWIGGDRDGNPYVTPALTRAALQLARETILDHYVRALEALVERLSMSTLQARIAPALEERLETYRATIPSLDPSPETRSPAEVYRRFLGYVGWRLRAARSKPTGAGGYADAASFAADLRLIRTSLVENRGARVAALRLDPLLRQVGTFGFHLHTLDIRQHAHVHARALEELFSGDDATLPPPPADDSGRLIATLRCIADLKRTYPPESIRSYVISGARGIDDVLALVRLLETSGVRVAAHGKDPGVMPVQPSSERRGLRGEEQVS